MKTYYLAFIACSFFFSNVSAQLPPNCNASYTYSPNPPVTCVDRSISYTSLYQSGAHNWNFIPSSTTGSPATVTGGNTANPDVIFNSPGTYYIQHTVSNLPICGTGTAIDTIRIDVPYDPSFTATSSKPGGTYCADDPITVTANELNASAIHTWDFDGGTIISGTGPAYVISYSTGGVKTITHNISNGNCVTSSQQNINVVKPDADFTYPTYCTYNPVWFTSIDRSTTATHIWAVDGGGTFQNPNYGANSIDPQITFLSSGPYTVFHTVTEGECTSVIQKQVTIKLYPDPRFNAVVIPCNLKVDFGSVIPTNPLLQNVSHSWNFGDPGSGADNTSTAASPSHTYPNFSSYTVTHTVTDLVSGCIRTQSRTVILIPPPDADFTVDDTTCINNARTIFRSNTQTGTHVWTFSPVAGSGASATIPSTSTSPNPQIVFCTDGQYRVTHLITYTNNLFCTDTITRIVNITAGPLASFNYINLNLICQKNLPVEFISAKNCLQNISHSWNFGDPASGPANTSTDADPSHLFSDYGTYTVIHTATNNANGCFLVYTRTVTLNPPPSPAFTMSDSVICSGDSIYFEGSLNCGSDITCSHSWVFLGGIPTLSNSKSLWVTYSNLTAQPITYPVLHIVTKGGCADSLTKYVTVNPVPNALFTSNSLFGCPGKPVCFTPYEQADIYAHEWSFGDGNQNNDKVPCHNYSSAGSYSVIHTITDTTAGCSDQKNLVIIIVPDSVCEAAAAPCSDSLSNHWTFAKGSIEGDGMKGYGSTFPNNPLDLNFGGEVLTVNNLSNALYVGGLFQNVQQDASILSGNYREVTRTSASGSGTPWQAIGLNSLSVRNVVYDTEIYTSPGVTPTSVPYICGNVKVSNDAVTTALAYYENAEWKQAGNLSGVALSMERYNGYLYLAGQFAFFSDTVIIANLVRYNYSTNMIEIVPDAPQGTINVLKRFGTNLYMGGDFITNTTPPGKNIASYNNITSVGVFSPVGTYTTQGNLQTIYGIPLPVYSIDSITLQLIAGTAAVSGDLPIPEGCLGPREVHEIICLQLPEQVDDPTLGGVWRLDGTAPIVFGTGAWNNIGLTNGPVFALKGNTSNIFAGGYFTKIKKPGGAFIQVGNIAGISDSNSPTTDWQNVGPCKGMNNAVMALDIFDDYLYAGGLFDTAGAKRVDHLSKILIDGLFDLEINSEGVVPIQIPFTETIFRIKPTINNGVFTLFGNAKDNQARFNVILIDNLGRLIERKSINYADFINNEISLDFTNSISSPGLYFVRIFGNNFNQIEKIIIK